MTESNCRKKALPFLLEDFEKRCAYCLDPDEFRHPNQNHVEHFDCKLPGKSKHKYDNLMLSCSACNLSKLENPVTNPFDPEERLLNCTKENEFPQHIIESNDGQWEPVTKAGYYHLESIDLTEWCHKNKRAWRKKIAEQILTTCTTAIQYQSANPGDLHKSTMDMLKLMLSHLNNFPPLVTDSGVVSAKEWLKASGVDVGLLE